MSKVSDKIIELAARFLGKKYALPLGLHSEMKPILLSVGAPVGADVGMAWVYYIVSQACEKVDIRNPLLATAWALEQIRNVSPNSYKATAPYYRTRKPVVLIDFSIIEHQLPDALIRKGDIFLIVNDCGQYRCGFVLDVKPKEFTSIEPLLSSFESKRRKYTQLSYIIRIC